MRAFSHLGALLSLLTLGLGCAPGAGRTLPALPSASTFGEESTGQIAVHTSSDKPVVTTVVRGGDPSAAIAASVLTDGDGLASTALGALVEGRLRAAGVATVETRADRDGYRVFALVSTPAQTTEFVQRLQVAMTTPVVAGAPELQLAARRLAALRAHPLDSPALLPIVQCTGELSALPTDAWFDPTTTEGAARLERLRRTAHVQARVSIASVGPAAIADQLLRTLQAGPSWDTGPLPRDPWPEQDRITAYAQPGSADLPPKLHLALRVRGAFTATAVAERSARANSPLLARVAATNGWQISRISATVRPRGACLSLTLDRTQGASPANLEADAARAASLVANELETSFSEVRADGSVAGRQVLRASDPREAASLAAWWSQASRLEAGPDRMVLSLGLPPPALVPTAPADALDKLATVAEQRFAAAYRTAHKAWDQQALEAYTRLEPGQGELWVLAASPCGVLAETESEAGITALAAIAAAQPMASTDGVSIEPWVAQDGVGILAHAQPLPGEGPHSLARRVADAAAHALIHQRISDTDLAHARSAVLALMDPPDAPFPASLGSLARTLAPGQSSWLVPFGLRPRVVDAGSAAVDLRWTSLAEGPIRVAVLANVDEPQAATAVRSLDRWLARTEEPRTCSPVSPVARYEAVHLTVDSTGELPRALLGAPIATPDGNTDAMLDLLVEALNGDDGWLARSLVSFRGRITARARALGGPRRMAWVIDIRGPDGQLDAAVQQVRGMIDRLARGAATGEDLERARSRLAQRDQNASLDPRARLVAVWHHEQPRPAPALSSWNAWMSRVLAAEQVSSVRVKLPDSTPGAERDGN